MFTATVFGVWPAISVFTCVHIVFSDVDDIKIYSQLVCIFLAYVELLLSDYCWKTCPNEVI